jgi:hypothetical protein
MLPSVIRSRVRIVPSTEIPFASSKRPAAVLSYQLTGSVTVAIIPPSVRLAR